MPWTLADMPSQTGRLAIVTGANSGIGYETALALARAGARVIVAARSEEKGRAAARAIGGRAEWRPLDLASLASVAAFAEELGDAPIDLLILNAGVMALPTRQLSADGFELQLATNFIGHFALAARLWPRLAEGGRVVPLASIAARRCRRFDFDDPMAERRYRPWAVYAQTKLAMLMFGLELARRSPRIASIPAHPGFARTSLIPNGPGRSLPRDLALRLLGDLVSQPAADGALPVLRAATDPSIRSGDYIGSIGPFELRGPPGHALIPPQAREPEDARRLWALAEGWTGLPFAP